MGIGEKIKEARAKKKFSLRELAEMTGLSASFISQVEQEKASPSIETLKKIANLLGVKVSYLIEDESEELDMVKKGERRYIESIDSNIKMALLTSSSAEKHMEPILYEIGPQGESGRGYYHHQGEEFIFVIEGSLDIYIEDEVHTLECGDSFYFKSSKNHRFKNKTNKITRAIWVVTPPTF